MIARDEGLYGQMDSCEGCQIGEREAHMETIEWSWILSMHNDDLKSFNYVIIRRSH